MMPGQFGNRDLPETFDVEPDNANTDADERLWAVLAAIKQIAHVNEGICGICDPALAAIITRYASDGFSAILTLIDQAEAAFGELERVRTEATEVSA